MSYHSIKDDILYPLRDILEELQKRFAPEWNHVIYESELDEITQIAMLLLNWSNNQHIYLRQQSPDD